MEKRNHKRNKGFTLIEVIVAVSIVIILATLAVPKVSAYLSKAKEAKAMSVGKQIYNAAMWSYTNSGDKFTANDIKSSVSSVSNVNLSENPTVDGDKATINFTSDSNTYEVVVDGVNNSYTITGKTGSDLKYSSTN